jgi:CHAT domain-containing protein
MLKRRIDDWFANTVPALPVWFALGFAVLCFVGAFGAHAAVQESATDRARRKLIEAESAHGSQSAQAATALSSWLEVAFAHYWHEGHASAALADAERLVALRAELDGEQSLPFAYALQYLGRAFTAKFEYDQAAAAFERAAEIVQQQKSSEASRASSWTRILRGLGWRNLRKDWVLADQEVRLGLKDESTLTSAQRAAAWLTLVGISELQQKHDLSEISLDHAETALRSARLARHPLHADILRYRSLLAIDRGDPGAALNYAQSAVAAADNADPVSPSLRFITTYSLGQIEQRLGQLDEASKWFERAARIPELPVLNGGYSIAMLQYSVCGNLLRRKRYADAEPHCRDSASRFEGLPRPMLVEACNAWNNVGVSLRDRGQAADAIEPLRKSLELAERAGPEFALWANAPLMNLAQIRLHRGEFVEAERLLQKRLAILDSAGDFAPTNRRSTWIGLGIAHWGMGDVAQAFAYASKAEVSAARVRYITAADLAEERALQLIDQLDGGLDRMLQFAVQANDAQMLATTWEASMQAFGTQTIMAARRFRVARASTDPSLKSVWDEWKVRNDALTQARTAAARSNDIQHHAALDAAEQSFKSIDQILAQRTGGEAAYAARTHLTMSDVRAALPEGASLVRFIRAPFYDPTDDYAVQKNAPDQHVLAMVLESSAALRIIDLGPEATIAESARRWYALASRADGDAALLSRVSQKLWQQLWQPLALQGRRVFVVPGIAALSRVNFVALQDAKGRFLIERGVSVHLLNHEFDLLRTKRPSAARRLLLVGAPEFAARSRQVRDQDACVGALSALPGAAKELDILSAIADATGTERSTLMGAAASEARLMQALPGKSMLHFATHGIHVGSACRPGSGITRGVQVTAAVDASKAEAQDLAALALSSAEANPVDSANDGLLTSAEITALDLTDVDWAVLSACETALGPDLSQEGVGGLRRALALAGARSVIMSLWRVDDLATVEFMDALYRQRLVDHASTDQAMQAATGQTLKKRRQRGESLAPYYWAGFVASGDWR